MKEIPTIEKPETKEKEPRISYEFFYSPHIMAKDFEKLEQAFNKADIYVPEGTEHTPESMEIYNQLSRGETTPMALALTYEVNLNSNEFKQF